MLWFSNFKNIQRNDSGFVSDNQNNSNTELNVSTSSSTIEKEGQRITKLKDFITIDEVGEVDMSGFNAIAEFLK